MPFKTKKLIFLGLFVAIQCLYVTIEQIPGVQGVAEASVIGDRRAKSYSSQGMGAMSKDDFAQAVQYFQLAVQREPENTSYLTLLAWSYFKANQFDDALATFEQIKGLDPAIIDTYTGPGWVSFKSGKFDEAIKHFEEALTVNKESSDAFSGLGWAYFRKNELSLAKVYLDIALSKGMKNYSGTEPEAHRALGYMYFSQGNFRKAMNHFKIAVHHMPGWNDARVKWGDCLFALGKYPESITLYRYALRHEQTAEIYDKLGWAFFHAEPMKLIGSRQKNLERAAAMFNRALALDEQYADSKAGLEAINKINMEN